MKAASLNEHVVDEMFNQTDGRISSWNVAEGDAMSGYFLVVEVLGIERLDLAMGQAIMDSALVELSGHVSDLTNDVLSFADASTPAQLLRRGCWSAFFKVDSGSSICGEAEESINSILTAAQQWADEAALEVFAPASATMATMKCSIRSER